MSKELMIKFPVYREADGEEGLIELHITATWYMGHKKTRGYAGSDAYADITSVKDEDGNDVELTREEDDEASDLVCDAAIEAARDEWDSYCEEKGDEQRGQ